jgi:Holliday junction resolvase RusA-like endonuclease
MKVELNERFKLASVWLTNEEKNNLEIRKELDIKIKEFKEKKYRFVIYESGERDLTELTQGLLSHNKNLLASER